MKLTNVKHLSLRCPQVTDEEVVKLRKALPNCMIGRRNRTRTLTEVSPVPISTVPSGNLQADGLSGAPQCGQV